MIDYDAPAIATLLGCGTTQAAQVLAGPPFREILIFRVNQKLISVEIACMNCATCML